MKGTFAVQNKIPETDKHIRPAGVSDETVAATGKVSEALETIERARGHLYELHQLIGHADLMFDEAVKLLDDAGHLKEAEVLRRDIIGLNVLPGRWTFQVVEEFNDGYYEPIKAYEKSLRDKFLEGRQHVYESEMKEERRTKNKPGHEARP